MGAPEVDCRTPESSRVVEFPSSAFSLDAVKRAAYALMARINVVIAEQQGRLICTLTPAGPGGDPDQLEQLFRREVLDQDLRLTLEAKTEPMRTAILGLAFSRTGLQRE